MEWSALLDKDFIGRIQSVQKGQAFFLEDQTFHFETNDLRSLLQVTKI